MGFFSFLGVQSKAHIGFFTLFSRGKKVGTDQFGNTYYEGKPIKGYKRPRRWVMYKGAPEATKIPPEWHCWIHRQTNIVPSEAGQNYRRDWQKEYTPNMTGTDAAYHPPGHILEGGERDKATGDYEAWTPEN